MVNTKAGMPWTLGSSLTQHLLCRFETWEIKFYKTGFRTLSIMNTASEVDFPYDQEKVERVP